MPFVLKVTQDGQETNTFPAAVDWEALPQLITGQRYGRICVFYGEWRDNLLRIHRRAGSKLMSLIAQKLISASGQKKQQMPIFP